MSLRHMEIYIYVYLVYIYLYLVYISLYIFGLSLSLSLWYMHQNRTELQQKHDGCNQSILNGSLAVLTFLTLSPSCYSTCRESPFVRIPIVQPGVRRLGFASQMEDSFWNLYRGEYCSPLTTVFSSSVILNLGFPRAHL